MNQNPQQTEELFLRLEMALERAASASERSTAQIAEMSEAVQGSIKNANHEIQEVIRQVEGTVSGEKAALVYYATHIIPVADSSIPTAVISPALRVRVR